MSLDNDTRRNLTEADHIANMTQSDGWHIVKAKLDERILDLQNIANLDDSSADAMALDIRSRKMAANLIFDWLKQDIYGFVEQQSIAGQAFTDKRPDEYIERS